MIKILGHKEKSTEYNLSNRQNESLQIKTGPIANCQIQIGIQYKT